MSFPRWPRICLRHAELRNKSVQRLAKVVPTLSSSCTAAAMGRRTRDRDRRLLPWLPAGMSGFVQRKSAARGNLDKH